jgi:predicted O-methyltransferase YrrM
MSNPLDDCLNLMQTVVEYRHQPIIAWLREMRKKRSMLHEDVLVLIYHLSKTAPGNLLEIGAYIGGSAIAAGVGMRDGGRQRISVTVEPGGAHKHPRLPSKNILADLRKNLAREKLDRVFTIIEGYSGNEHTVAAVKQVLPPASVGFLIIDADGSAGRDLNLYRSLLTPGCWLVIDDYYGPRENGKVGITKAQVDELVAAGQLRPLGVYGWGTWVGRLADEPSA